MSIVQFPELPAGEEAFLIELFSNPINTLTDVKEEYQKIFVKSIAAEMLQKIFVKHKKTIESRKAEFLKHPGKIPSSNPSVRIFTLEKVIKQLISNPAVKAQKVGEDQWESWKELDAPSIIQATRAIREEIQSITKIQLERARIQGIAPPALDGDLFPEIDIGMEEAS